MPRQQRVQHQDAYTQYGWAQQSDFNEQLYNALKHAPWWMISIAFHVIVLVIASLLWTEEGSGNEGPQMNISAQNQLEEEDLDDAEDTEEIHSDEIVSPEPVIKDEEISDHVETDNDLPYDESLGEDGISDAPFTGPANNGLIGLGGGAGGAFGGRGGSRDLDRGCGGRRTQGAVEDALKWLAAHQSSNGGWEAAGFHKWCDGKSVA